MKTRIIAMGTVAAAGAFALAGVALAQTVPSQFVVSGANAEKIAEACEAAAKAEGVEISISVLDNDGKDVYKDRMDGQGYLNIVTADMKAKTALADRSPSKNRMNTVLENPDQMELRTYQLGEFPNSGGLPIVINHQLIGVVGVGGSRPNPPVWSDEICGHKALEQVIGAANVPPLVKDLPRKPRPPQKAPVPKFQATMAPKSSLPAEWVVSGKDAANIFSGYQISLAAAKKIARTCRDFAAAHNGGATIYVIDNAGEFVHMERMDGEVNNNVRTALMKAQTALRARQPTSIRAADLKNDPSGYPRSAAWYNFYAVSGGIPIVVDGEMLGAVGVGGGAGGGGDENCAIEGLKATFGDRVALPKYPQQASAG